MLYNYVYLIGSTRHWHIYSINRTRRIMNTFRILSIDGGGIRSLYTAVLLNRIAEEVPEMFEETHFFAGSSTGSILSMGLAFGIPAAELVEIMRAYGQVVLHKSIVQEIGQVISAKYDIMNLRKLLTPYFGAAILLDLSKRYEQKCPRARL